MEKFIKLFWIIFIIPLFIANTSSSQETYKGSWIISSDYIPDYSGYKNFKLDFGENEIINGDNPELLSSSDEGDWSFIFSMGAYESNGELDTYVTDRYSYPTFEEWVVNGGDYNICTEAQIIRTGEDPTYRIFYSSSYINTQGADEGVSLHCVNLDVSDNNPSFIEDDFVFHPIPGGGSLNSSKIGFTISNYIDSERTIYTIASSEELDGLAGLKSFTIDESGIDYSDVLIENVYQEDGLKPHQFAAFNLEMQNKNEIESPILAWILSPISTNANDTIYIYDEEADNSFYILDFSSGNQNGLPVTGRIAGIEFSPFADEPFYMYVSCQNLGLIKIDWRDGTLIEQIASGFSHSYVQTAPDGNVYVVSNDGTRFGKVDKSNGHSFDAEAFQYPFYVNPNGDTTTTPLTHINYKQHLNGGIEYYTLPENDQPVIKVDVQATNILCDQSTAIVSIYVSGGIPPYEIEVNRGTTDVSGLFSWDEECGCFRGTQLIAGTYEYTITDSGTTGDIGIEGEFEIAEGDAYDFEDNLLEINQETAANINGLSDLVWDENDVSPQKGFLLDNTIMFKHGFRLDSNTVLTINNLRLEFDEDFLAKVIIEPGSKLVLNNCTLTNYHCSDTAKKWAGIEVWGDPNYNQDPKPRGGYFQGYLEISNSTIEHAQTAVALRKDSTWASHGGGIVKAHNVDFLNNAKSVHFAPYQNMFFRTDSIDTIKFEMVNESRFELCDFIINGSYLEDSYFYKIADIVQVHRIPFLGCDFILDNNSEYLSPYNNAIAAYSAGVSVNKYDDENPSTFSGFYCAIYSSHNPTTNNYYSMVRNSDFINNSVGIRNTGTNNFKIIDNHFEIGENNGGKGACGWAPGYGVDIRAASLYVIENNSFIPFTGNTGDNYGVRLYETATDYTEVYNNEYDDLTIGNLSIGLNTNGGNDAEGVAYLCNDHDGSFIDILLTGDVEEDIEICHDNGSDYYASGNTFSSNANMHIQNDGQEIITFYCKGIQTPDDIRCTPIYIDLDSAASLNTCPDHFGGSGGGIGLDPIGRQAKEEEFNDAILNYSEVESLYVGLTDGGDTEGTELTIAAAQPGDTWELRANLLGMSPYLSKEVLIEAANKTDVLPESVLFEILSANPDELRKADLLDYLENKEEPLPEYMINILKQMATGTTAKTALLREMRSYKRDKIKAASEIIHSILIEEELDHEDLRTWLANLESYNGDRQIISSFIAQGDIYSAQTLLDLLPELYGLNGDALSEHNEWADLMNMQLNWQAEGRNPTDLTEAELATLNNLADNGGTKAKYQARGILEHFYGENYIDCCTPPDGNKSTVADFSKNDLAKAMGLSIVANPNPAKEYTEISYTLPYGVENADLLIFDLSGRLIEQKQLNSPINKLAYNTSRLPAGSYTIEIKTNDYSYATKLIIQ